MCTREEEKERGEDERRKNCRSPRNEGRQKRSLGERRTGGDEGEPRRSRRCRREEGEREEKKKRRI